VREAITMRMPDTLLCGTEFPDGDIMELIRDIRHNRIGNKSMGLTQITHKRCYHGAYAQEPT